MSNHQLWLKLGREVVFERGYGSTHTPRDRADWLWGTGWELDPLTGYACPKIEWTLASAYTWQHETSANVVNGSHMGVTCPVVTGTGTWTSTTTATLAAGWGFHFAWLPYQGSGPLWLRFGQDSAQWLVRLEKGVAELLDAWGQTMGVADLWPLDDYHGQWHYLLVYCAGRTLCLRKPGDAPYRGIMWTAEQGWPVQAGKLAVTGTGRIGFQAAPERHGTSMTVRHSRLTLPEPSTMPHDLNYWLVGGKTPDPIIKPATVSYASALTRYAEGGQPVLGVEDDPPTAAYEYTITATCPADGPNVYLTRTRVRFAPRTGPDGLVGSDLLAMPGVAVQSVEEDLTIDGGGNQLSFQLIANRGQLSPYVQQNMTVGWAPFGIARFSGFTSRPQLQVVEGGTLERLSFECEDRGKLLRESFWTGDGSYGGRTLATAYRDVVRKTGLRDDEIFIFAGGYTLPSETPDGRELFDFRNDQRIEDVLGYLHENFGAEHVLRWTATGEFIAEMPRVTHSGVIFETVTLPSEVPAVGLGTSVVPRILRASYQEAIIEDGFANVVAVVGTGEDGEPLCARMTDWSSVNDPSAVNYWGSFRPMVIVDAGLTSQAVVNWVCAQVYHRVRRMQVQASWRGMYLPWIVPGDWVDVRGLGTWQITGMRTAWTRDQPDGLTEYAAAREVG